MWLNNLVTPSSIWVLHVLLCYPMCCHIVSSNKMAAAAPGITSSHNYLMTKGREQGSFPHMNEGKISWKPDSKLPLSLTDQKLAISL